MTRQAPGTEGSCFAASLGTGDCYPHSPQAFGGAGCSLQLRSALPCQTGQFQSATGQSRCEKCTNGTFANTKGSLSCTACEAGRVSEKQGASNCTACSMGRSQSASGQRKCDECTAGTYMNEEGSINCKICKAGTVSALQGATACDSCVAGKYQAAPAQAVRVTVRHNFSQRVAREYSDSRRRVVVDLLFLLPENPCCLGSSVPINLRSGDRPSSCCCSVRCRSFLQLQDRGSMWLSFHSLSSPPTGTSHSPLVQA